MSYYDIPDFDAPDSDDEAVAPKRSRWYPDTLAKKVGAGAVALLAIGGIANLGDDSTESEPLAQVESETVTTVRARPLTPPTTDANAAMVSWISSHGHVLFDIIPILTKAEQAASHAADGGDTGPLIDACGEFGDVIRAAQAAPSMPVSSVDRPWQAALDSYSRFADACVLGVELYDPSLLVDALTYMTEGTSHLEAATAALEATQ